MSEQNKWALPPGALERHFRAFWPYLLFGARWECQLIFSLIPWSKRFYITYQKIKEIGPKPFESTPGHPSSQLVAGMSIRIIWGN